MILIDTELPLSASGDGVAIASFEEDGIRGIELDPRGAREVEIAAIEEQLASGEWMGKP